MDAPGTRVEVAGGFVWPAGCAPRWPLAMATRWRSHRRHLVRLVFMCGVSEFTRVSAPACRLASGPALPCRAGRRPH